MPPKGTTGQNKVFSKEKRRIILLEGLTESSSDIELAGKYDTRPAQIKRWRKLEEAWLNPIRVKMVKQAEERALATVTDRIAARKSSTLDACESLAKYAVAALDDGKMEVLGRDIDGSSTIIRIQMPPNQMKALADTVFRAVELHRKETGEEFEEAAAKSALRAPKTAISVDNRGAGPAGYRDVNTVISGSAGLPPYQAPIEQIAERIKGKDDDYNNDDEGLIDASD